MLASLFLFRGESVIDGEFEENFALFSLLPMAEYDIELVLLACR